MMRRPRGVVGSLAVAALVVLATGCAKPAPGPETSEIIVYGDSLAEESAAFLQTMTWPKGFVQRMFGGTAVCDWAADTSLALTPASMVVITFTGNSQTPCMSDGSGGFLRGQALVDRYRTGMKQLVDRARDAGAWVVLVGQPARANDPLGASEVEGLNALSRELAAEAYVAFVDAGATVENADGSAAQSLPCVAGELECAPSGSNLVRNNDGVHLCPALYVNPCPVYSSGAWRFANAIATAVANPKAFD